MYYVGIDISKYKHDCFICDSNGVVIRDSFSFDNSKEGFNVFLSELKHLDCSQKIKIGLEATGHYGINLKIFLNDNGFEFCEFNPLLIKRLIDSHSLRRTKTDRCDARKIAAILADSTVAYKPYRILSYHIQELKSLTRVRESLVKQRSLQLQTITNILDRVFPEFKPFFNNKLSNTAIFILEKYKSPSRIARWSNKDLETVHNFSKKTAVYEFVKLKNLAKETVGNENSTDISLLQSILNIYESIDVEVTSIEEQIISIMNNYDSPITSIPGISTITAATIISEYEDISRFDNPNQMLAYAGLEPSKNQSGTENFNGHMVKHGSGHLRYALFNCVPMVCIHNQVFYSYYCKKLHEGKHRRVAQSHVVKKLIRVIFTLEKNNLTFNSDLLK